MCAAGLRVVRSDDRSGGLTVARLISSGCPYTWPTPEPCTLIATVNAAYPAFRLGRVEGGAGLADVDGDLAHGVAPYACA